ncbi:MAG: hypothetical protein ACKVQA_10655 [Burkholderiales bacterium]
MPWLKWLPWRLVLSRVAHAHGFLDPIPLLARLERLAQPSEVAQPVELLRAGAVFHARGLINSRVIQHNLDWVWPYWIERQFDPADDAFIPRAFSITHVNLTHRNWTAVGWPDCDSLPIADPRGLLTPLRDGWSLDGWIVTDDGRRLLPSRARSAKQWLELEAEPTVITETAQDSLSLRSEASVIREHGMPVCRLRLRGQSPVAGWMVLALCPFNPEGISFIHDASLAANRKAWRVEGKATVRFSDAADRHHVSDYRRGSVLLQLSDAKEQSQGQCDVGMTTAVAMFALKAGEPREICATVAIEEDRTKRYSSHGWRDALEGCCELSVPEERVQFLYDAALRTLVLHSPGDVYPGPYTYKRFWFRDAAFIIHAMLCVGLAGRAERALDRFPPRQNSLGYFHSQEGEWDSNGEALWIMQRFCELQNVRPKTAWRQAIVRAANWIARKRTPDQIDSPHAGLFPPGFSAEHLGPNDYYYWDDFWGIAGLHAAAWLCARMGDTSNQTQFQRLAGTFQDAVHRSLSQVETRLGREAMPASPYRRMDSGAIGSLATGYPLQLCAPRDPRLLDTAEFLIERCLVRGGFFQDMIHSGINPYLTLHLAQVLLRAEDSRYLGLMDAVGELATPTGQWPEAIHPRTGGGCMGDGQHVWAAAEWLMMIRNAFVREDREKLILCQGIPRRWLDSGEALRFGPAPTAFGSVSLTLRPHAAGRELRVSWTAQWHGQAPPAEIRVPGFTPVTAVPGTDSVELVCLEK